MNRRLKSGISKYLVKSGILELLKGLTGRNSVILNFHRVRPVGALYNPFDTCPSVSSELFRKILLHLKQFYKIVSLSEICENLQSIHQLAAVTFDDGWRDNYEVAFPILQELGIIATIFVATGKIGSSEPFWQQILGECFQVMNSKSNIQQQEKFKLLLGLNRKVSLDQKVFQRTVEKWKSMSAYERKMKLDSITTIYNPAGRTRCFINEEEIKVMTKYGIEFGAHTVNHIIMTRESAPVVEAELFESKKVLENIIKSPVDAVAYPNGDFSKQTIGIAKALGFRIGCTTRNSAISKYHDLMQLPRIDPDWEQLEDADGKFNEYLYRWKVR